MLSAFRRTVWLSTQASLQLGTSSEWHPARSGSCGSNTAAQPLSAAARLRLPDAEMALGHRAAPGLESPHPQIPQHHAPRLFRFTLAAFHRQDHLAPIRQHLDQDEDAALPASRPALTYSPLTHTDTTSSSSSRRCFQVSYSWCHWALSRCNEAAESGAPSPNRSRSASSNSPSARPCRDNRGSSSPTGLVRRVNHGRSRLTNRLLTPCTGGVTR